MSSSTRIPLALKLAYSAWFLVWVPVYWIHHGAANFLWFCDLANVIVLFALWSESAVWLSSQLVGGLFIQAYWAVDFFGRLLFGTHPFGGTEYMFITSDPLWLRGFSLFHIAVPILLLWTIYRLGYDRRGWQLQTILAWMILPLSMLPDAERNLNWVWRPFGVEQVWLPPGAYLVFCMLAYPLILYLPAHWLLQAWMRRVRRPVF
jgi:hypothetical protein